MPIIELYSAGEAEDCHSIIRFVEGLQEAHVFSDDVRSWCVFDHAGDSA